MKRIKVGLKLLHKDAVVPQYSREGDAAMDLVAVSKHKSHMYTEYCTGLAMAIPEGYVGLVFPRSSISNKDQALANSVGVIDSGYRGEITARFKNTECIDVIGGSQKEYSVGERVCQIMIIERPEIEWDVCDELPDSERGEGGYGSTGH